MYILTYKNLGKEADIIKYMADNLHSAIREEAEVLCPGTSVLSILSIEAQSVEIGFVIFDDDGHPYGMGGIKEDGRIFFVVRDKLNMSMNVKSLKAGSRWIEGMLFKYPCIYGYCWEKATKSQQWMKWMHFKFPEDKTTIFNNEKFLYFERKI